MAERKGSRNPLSFILKVAATIGVLWLVVDRLGWSHIVDTVEHADWRWLALAVVVFVVSSVIGVVQWKLLLDNRGMKVSFWRALVLYFVGLLFNNIMLGMVAGDAVKVAMLKSDGGNGSGRLSLAATFLDRLAGLWAMMAFAVVGSIILLLHGLSSINSHVENATIALAFAFIGFCLLCAVIISQRIQKLIFSLIDILPLPGKDKIREIISELFLEVHDRHILLPVICLSTVIQTMRIGVHILCAASLGILTADNFQYFFVFVPMTAIIMLVPFPFGVREVIAGGLFVMAGFRSDAAVVMQFLATLVGVAGSIFSGVLFLTSHFAEGGTSPLGDEKS